MNNFKGHAPISLADQVYLAIKKMIFDFELLPGHRFAKITLSRQLFVSRTPLRQALQKLEIQGLVQVLPKLGWFGTPIDFNVMDELYDLRFLLENYAAQNSYNKIHKLLSF